MDESKSLEGMKEESKRGRRRTRGGKDTSKNCVISKLMVLFKAYPILDKNLDVLAVTYESLRGGGLGLDKLKLTNTDDLLKHFDIFEQHYNFISISRPKLLRKLLEPISNYTGKKSKTVIFKEVNGFDAKELCDYCNVAHLDQLLQELHDVTPPTGLPIDSHKKSQSDHDQKEVSASSSLPPTGRPDLDFIPLDKPSGVHLRRPPLLSGPHPPHSFIPSPLSSSHPHILPPPPHIHPRMPPNPSRMPPNPPRMPLNPPSHFPPPPLVSSPLPINPPHSPYLPFSSPNPLLPPQKRPAVSVPQYLTHSDERPPPVKRSNSNEEKNDQSNSATMINQASLKIPPSSILTFEPSEAPSHFPDPDIHPRDIVHIPSINYTNTSTDITLDKPVTPHFSKKDNKKDILTKVNTYLSTFIGFLSSQGKHLPMRVVDEETRQVLRAAVKRTGVHIDSRDVECLRSYEMLYKRIIEFIRVFCWHSPITSLFELQRIIIEFEKVSDFRDLKLGPITKHPEVVRLFQVPMDLQSVPEITAYDIHSKLFGFLNKTKKNEKHQIEDFLMHMTDIFKVSSPHHLCIRITSFPLACQINFKFRTSQRRIREKMEHELELSVSKEIDFELNVWKKSLQRMSSESPKELERKNPFQLLESLLNFSLKLFPSHLRSRVRAFLDVLRDNEGLRKLFLLALYEGVYGVQKMQQEVPPTSSNNTVMTTGGASSFYPSQQQVYRTQSELHNEVIRYIKQLKYPISLESLAQTEQALLAELGASYFGSFEHGTFLEFISKHPSILNALGGSTISNDNYEKGKGRDKTKQKRRDQILICIKQIKNQSDHESIGEILLQQFQVDTVGQLGCGDLDKLVNDSISTSFSSSTISYMSPLLANSDVLPTTSSSYIQENALDIIQSAPLLTDLAIWSHWDLLFKESLGPLGIFLHDNGIACLCVSPGTYLKIDANSTLQDFTDAIEGADPSKLAGHLVSMAVKAGCINNVSTQLLARHVHTKLTSMSAVELKSPELFVLECLVCMPLELSATIGKQVFLDPLRGVMGSVNVDITLLQLATTKYHWRRYLHALGIKLGIKIWIDDFRDMITKPADPIDQPVMEMMETSTTFVSSINTSIHIASTNNISLTMEEKQEENQEKEQEEKMEEEEKEDGRDLTSVSLQDVTFKVEECHEIIESIRRDEFGIGLEHNLNEHQKMILDKQKERLGRSLQRLSEELYSKDTHFVLELVQNADDNTYPSSMKHPPSLKFSLSKTCVTIFNNEVGFLENNIRAICDVGKSTKDRHNSGYIGQKGIGFKSVFRVTEVPQIHSNGFHIKFDIQSGDPMGYILPQWIEEEDILDQSELNKWTTKIVLPLKTADSNNILIQSHNMMSKFKDIQPSLLLFLNRLRCIIIEDKDSGEAHKMTRYDKENGIIEIHHDDNIDKWLVVKKILTGANQYKPQVDATELALAFPLPDNLHSPSFSAKDLCSQQVFAFLPLRSYGFRFIVQGDFDLPSSREDVNSNSAWNQWLREGIAQLFMTAIESFKALPGLSQVQAMLLILNFIPLEGEIHDFFQPVTREILRLIKGTECLPTDFSPKLTNTDAMINVMSIITKRHLNNEKQFINWKQPSQLLYVKQQLIRDCIPQSLLTSALKLHYLNDALNDAITSHLCAQLSIGSINIDHLIGVAHFVLNNYHEHKKDKFISLMGTNFENDYGDNDGMEPDDNDPFKCLIKWLALWLACVHFLYEDECTKDVTVLNKLKQIQIIPLSNGQIVSLETHAVFFPPVSNKTLEKTFQPIYGEIHTVHQELRTFNDDDINEVTTARVFSLLTLLGVKDLNFNDVIYHHIIPQFKSEQNIMAKKDKMLVLYLAFIKHAIEKNMIPEQRIIADLKEDIVLVTNKGRLKPAEIIIHFDPAYKFQQDLSKVFPGVKWILVSPKYLSFDNNLNWRDFLANLGVQSELTVKRINENLNPSSAKAISTWNISKWKRSPDGRYTIRDYCCQDFDQIIQSIQNLSLEKQSEQMRDLAEMISKSWESKYNSCTIASYYDGSNSNELGTVTSTFGRTLLKTAWLPAVGLDLKPLTIGIGSQLYHMTDELKSLLHNHVHYLSPCVKSLNMIQYLSVKTTITPRELLDMLCKWSENSDSFCTSLAHMRNVYIQLARQIESDRLIERSFNDKSLIFMPSITQWRTRSSVDIEGKFIAINKAYWTDKTTVLFNMLKSYQEYPFHLPQILSFFYSSADESVKRQIKYAFSSLGVAKDINLEHLIEVLDYNSSLSPSPSDDQISSFRSISECIVSCIASEGIIPQVNKELFKAKVKESKVFPSKCGNWVSLDGLYFDDDPEVSKYFVKSTSQQVHFLNWPNATDQRALQDFIQVCDIPLVSEEIQLSLNPVSVRPFNDIRISFHFILPLVQQFLVTKLSNELSIEHNNNVAKTLTQLQYFSTLELTCTYCLSDRYYANAILRQCKLQESDPPVVYIVVNEQSEIFDKSSLVDVICRLVLPIQRMPHIIDTLSRFVQELLLENPRSDNAQKRFVDKHNLKQIPPEFNHWIVELPAEKPAPAPVLEKEQDHDDSEEEMESEEVPFVSNESTPGSTSWPPRAPLKIDDENEQKHSNRTHKIHTTGTSEINKRREMTESDVITLDDVRKMKNDEVSETHGETRSHRLYSEEKREFQGQHTSSNVQQQTDSKCDTTPISTSLHYSQSSREGSSLHHTSTGKDNNIQQHVLAGEEPTALHQSSIKIYSDTTDGNKKSPNFSHQHHGPIPHTSESATVSNETLPPYQYFDLPSVDMTTLLQTLTFEHDARFVPQKVITGRWGEEYVFNLFSYLQVLPNGAPIIDINWVNEIKESYSPYDIKVTTGIDSTEPEVFYIEVKSTQTQDKSLIPISWHEIKFAQKTRQNYLLVRVYNACNENQVQIKWLMNLSDTLDNNPSVLYLQM